MDYDFIPCKDAMMVWNLDDKFRKITELHIYEWNLQDRRDYEKGLKYPPFRHCHMSAGNCDFSWKDESIDYIICRYLSLLIDHPPENLKKCLIELGRIEEMECIRKLVYNKFFCDDYTYDEFLKNIYS